MEPAAPGQPLRGRAGRALRLRLRLLERRAQLRRRLRAVSAALATTESRLEHVSKILDAELAARR
ncbi:MAG TPA: hypothetical protein VK714_10170 [Myxococcota bacterium]|nr:hypothetical protein [Myxococcota bacterium]